MAKRKHILLPALLGAALLVSLVFGVYSAKEASRARRLLEDNYTQRLLESREHLQSIALKLGKLPAAGEPATLIELLGGASIQAESLVSGLSSLPLSHAAMEEAIAFSNQVSEYSLLLCLRLASGQPLTESQRAKLSELCSQCRLLEGQFALAWDAMLRDSLRLTGQENVYYQEPETASRPLEMAGAGSMEYPSMIYDGAFSDMKSTGVPKALGSELISEEEAMKRVVAYVGRERVKEAVHSADVAGHLPCYGVSLALHDGVMLNAAVTKQGGKLLWMMPETAEFAAALTLEECRKSALDFLQAHDYGRMESTHFQVYDGLAVISFAAVQEEVLLYPDLVKVQLRMDTGEVVGLDANHYLINHTVRTKLTPGISAKEALDAVDEHLGGKQARLCLIPYRDSERLCYEVKGEIDGQEYRIYVDAETGHEVQVLLMMDVQGGQMSV